MLLKFSLLEKFSPDHLKRHYGHNLEKLWSRYKGLRAEKSLSKYNSLIKKLNKFEDLRYPTLSGYSIFIDFRKQYYSYQKLPTNENNIEYRLNLEQIDEFVSILLKDKVTSGWVNGLLFQGNAKELYEKHNLHKL
ncbi:hypothetical protein HY008_00050 [Candidatus Woesebacteria bacterium]|nr:hypothetical protein [Candidatus Woesebacteria bacterium]